MEATPTLTLTDGTEQIEKQRDYPLVDRSYYGV